MRKVAALALVIALSSTGLVSAALLAGLPGSGNGEAEAPADGPRFAQHAHGAHGHGGAGGFAAHASGKGADAHAAHGHDGEAMALNGDGFPLRERHAWPAEEGQVPSESDARSRLEEVNRIVVRADRDFADVEQLQGGGTAEDPFVLEGLYVPGDLYLADTDKFVIIRDSYIGGQLTLNWVGDRAYVHHNYIRDLRVNENVERTGAATAGLIEQNVIGFVGQLRHFDGVFRDNVVGPRPAGFFEAIVEDSGLVVPFFQQDLAFNFDGFNGAEVYRNVITGSVDIGFHGHHHSNGFLGHSHIHGPGAAKGHAMDHTDRWHSLKFHDNAITITSGGAALRYEDENHAGDDRRAASEQSDALERDHVHHSLVMLLRNTLDGGNLRVDVFNADDRLHQDENPGVLVLKDNVIGLTGPRERGASRAEVPWIAEVQRDGIAARSAKEMLLVIEGNHVRTTVQERPAAPLVDALGVLPWDAGAWLHEAPPSGIRLDRFDAGQVEVRGNTIEAFEVGVRARDFGESLEWLVEANAFRGVGREVDYDDSVEQGPGP